MVMMNMDMVDVERVDMDMDTQKKKEKEREKKEDTEKEKAKARVRSAADGYDKQLENTLGGQLNIYLSCEQIFIKIYNSRRSLSFHRFFVMTILNV